MKKYNDMPFKEWDGVTPFCIYDCPEDGFFEDEFELMDHIEENAEYYPDGIHGLELVICDPVRLNQFTEDDLTHHFEENLMEDCYFEDMASPDLRAAIDKVNKIIENHAPVGWWYDGEFRTTINIDPDAEGKQ